MNQPTIVDIEKAFKEAVVENTLCPLGKLLTEVSPDVRKVLNSKIALVQTYSAATIARVLRGLDLAIISPEMISKHRKGTCRCR